MAREPAEVRSGVRFGDLKILVGFFDELVDCMYYLLEVSWIYEVARFLSLPTLDILAYV